MASIRRLAVASWVLFGLWALGLGPLHLAAQQDVPFNGTTPRAPQGLKIPPLPEAPASVTRVGSMLTVFFRATSPTDYGEAREADTAMKLTRTDFPANSGGGRGSAAGFWIDWSSPWIELRALI